MLIVVWATEFHSANLGEKRIHFDAFYWDNWIINSPVIQSLSRLLAIPSNETILHLTLKIGTQKILKSENWQKTCFTWVHTEYSTVWLSFFIFQQYSDFLCKKTLNKLYWFVSIGSSKPWSLSGHLINQSYLNCKFFSPRTNLFSWHKNNILAQCLVFMTYQKEVPINSEITQHHMKLHISSRKHLQNLTKNYKRWSNSQTLTHVGCLRLGLAMLRCVMESLFYTCSEQSQIFIPSNDKETQVRTGTVRKLNTPLHSTIVRHRWCQTLPKGLWTHLVCR